MAIKRRNKMNKMQKQLRAKQELKELRKDIVEIYKSFMPNLYKTYTTLKPAQIALEVARVISDHVTTKAVTAINRKSRRKVEKVTVFIDPTKSPELEEMTF